MTAAALAVPRYSSRRAILLALVGVVLALASLWHLEQLAALRRDVALREGDGGNFRQRYIEWQAFTNLLEIHFRRI